LNDLKFRNLSKNIRFTLNDEIIKTNDKVVLFDSDGHIKLKDGDQLYN